MNDTIVKCINALKNAKVQLLALGGDGEGEGGDIIQKAVLTDINEALTALGLIVKAD